MKTQEQRYTLSNAKPVWGLGLFILVMGLAIAGVLLYCLLWGKGMEQVLNMHAPGKGNPILFSLGGLIFWFVVFLCSWRGLHTEVVLSEEGVRLKYRGKTEWDLRWHEIAGWRWEITRDGQA